MFTKILSSAAILLVLVGTALSLLTIIKTDPKYVGTIQEIVDRNENFKKEQKLVKVGIGLICIGSFMQIAVIWM